VSTHCTSLFELRRGEFLELSLFGEIVICDDRRVVFQTADALGTYPARSLLKPFQFYATGLTTKEEASPRFTASLGSISATREQVGTLKDWYASSSSQKLIQSLKVPASFPMDETHRVELKAKGEGPSPFFHMCFSKHMAILEACEKNGWSVENYTDTAHPYHKRLMESLSSLLGASISAVPCVADGCTLPSPVLGMRELALLYQRLAMMGGEMKKIRERMLKDPEWIGGPSRMDSKLMQANPGKLIAKEGADGLMGVGILPTKEHPSGLGIVVKILSGYQPPMSLLALGPLLEKLGLKNVVEAPKGQVVSYGYKPFEISPSPWIDISPLLHPNIAIWPGDKPFKRMASMETMKGQHMTLSAIETSVHVGAHTDAPNHFGKVREGISDVPVSRYLGACQVIEIKKPRGSSIVPQDLSESPIRAKRILFKTGSFPDPNRFTEDFVTLSSALVEHLGRLGVVLVGIDTPSIDPFSSKDLPAHQATIKHQVGILEGIILEKVSPGLYELLAQPLRIEGGDASPVRALLRPLA
jgi:arylformamidase